MIVKTIVLYPLLMYCGRIVLEDICFKYFLQESRLTDLVARWIIATTWVVLSCLLAIFVPDIAVAINYLGCIAVLFVFILPGLILYLTLFDPFTTNILSDKFWFLSGIFMLPLSVLFVSYGVFTMFIALLQSAR